ncbi:MAG: cupin domain-containing protein [Halobacteria archaeon]|nr:cupin domain-containing protein [Halobacteria archaeon]
MDEGYSKTSIDSIEERQIEDIEPSLKAVGYELRTDEMRPSVWVFDEGDSNRRHRHSEQEELYYFIDGSATIHIDGDEVEVEEGDFVAVSPDSWRRISTEEGCTVFAVGAPNVEGDEILESDTE